MLEEATPTWLIYLVGVIGWILMFTGIALLVGWLRGTRANREQRRHKLDIRQRRREERDPWLMIEDPPYHGPPTSPYIKALLLIWYRAMKKDKARSIERGVEPTLPVTPEKQKEPQTFRMLYHQKPYRENPVVRRATRIARASVEETYKDDDIIKSMYYGRLCKKDDPSEAWSRESRRRRVIREEDDDA